MIDHRTRKSHAIFVAALAMEPAEREEYLAGACGPDESVRAEVNRLLSAAETSAGFLETPAMGAGRPGGAPPGPPEVRGYRLIRILGVGGMATVYEAEQQSPRRRVALKIMHISLARTSALQRFRFEAEVLARLKHPGIAQVYEAGTCDDPGGHPAPFFAMEYVEDARPITAHARSEGMPLRARLAMLADVCDAVQYGHQVGVIHRDLKPANVLVDRSGRIKVIDFGIARSLAHDAERITRHADDGQLIGTLNSMSPEQCSGGQRIDTRTDVYALGVILYELVTGRLPHDLSRASVPDAVRVIQTVEPPRPGTITPEARGDLEAIIVMAMDKDPARRYDGAGSLATDLRRFLESKTVQACLPSPWHHARLFARRHKALFTAAAVTAATILIASGLTAWFAYRSWHDAGRRREAERIAIVERDAARRQAYSASIASAYLSYQAGETSRGRERLEAAPSILRGWEWGLIAAMLESDESTIAAHDDMIYAMDADPAGGRLATGSRDGSLGLRPIHGEGEVFQMPGSPGTSALAVALAPGGRAVYAGLLDGRIVEWIPESSGEVRTIATEAAGVISLDCSPSGLLVGATSAGTAHVWDPKSGAVVHTFEDQSDGVHGVRFSADGTGLLTWGHDGAVWIRESSGWSPRRQLDLGIRAEIGAFSPDGSMVAAGGSEGKLCVWNVHSGEVLMETTATASRTSIIAIAFASDGWTLFTGAIDRSIHEWTIRAGTVPRLLGRHDEAVSALYFHEPMGCLVSASRDRTVRLWPGPSGREPGPHSAQPAHDGHLLSAAFSPAGDLLATAGRDDLINVWEPTLGEKLATLSGHTGDIYCVRFSPNGRLLASASADGTVRLWNTETGEPAPPLGPASGSLWTVAFSPDGSRLAAAGEDQFITVWDVESRTAVQTIDTPAVRIISMAFDPSGVMLATCARDGAVRLWDAANGRELRALPGHQSDVFACVFSPDGTRLFTGSRDQTVRVWDPHTGELIKVLDCRGQFITSLSIDATGNRLAAGSWFAEVTVWDLQTLDPVFSFRGNSAAIRALAFSPTAPVLVCGGHDGILTTWSAEAASDRRAKRERATSYLAAADAILDRQADSLAVDDPDVDPELAEWLRKATLRRASVQRAQDEASDSADSSGP
jgi:WD40 repeat protein/serine/threonine protein kinase